MTDPRLYEAEAFVLLEAGKEEQIVTRDELLERLKAAIATQRDDLPRGLEKFSEVDEQAEYLLETSFELSLGPGEFLQWYAVRLEK